jgi:diamine N-acetyltransferase
MNIRLRPTLEDDLDFVLSAERGPENSPFVTSWTREQHLAALTSEYQSHLIIENIANGSRVGYIILAGLPDTNQSIEFRRIVVTEKGKGVGKAALQLVMQLAFEELKAHRLWLDVKEHNVRAQHVYESAGFVKEGVLRECIKAEDGFESLVVMSMLRREYEKPDTALQPTITVPLISLE